MKREQAYEIVNRINATWDQREMSEATAKVYLDAIEPLPFEAAGLAVLQLEKSETFRPSVALLLSTANEFLPGQSIPEADAAWAEVQEQISRVGSKRGMEDWTQPKNEDGTQPTHQPVWSHPVVGQLADSMGWDELCNSENVMADRAHFLKMYDDAAARNRREQNATPAEKQLRASLAGLLAKPEEQSAIE